MAEEEAQQTLGAVVQMVMEALSDSVSQLVLLVVSLAEQNAPLPPAVPPAAVGVAGAATTLTEVVRSLADEEYRDFEEIQQHILSAANDTDNAANGLISAVEVIKTSKDRKAGWNGLVEACRVIAGNTIRVLQIVYGAQLKRLLQVASQVSALLDAINPALLQTDPQKFADHMSETCGKIGDLGVYAVDKAQDEESPLTRGQLAEAGEGLSLKSDEMLGATNELLQNSNDPEAVRRLQETIDATRGLIAAVVPIVQEQAAQLAAVEGQPQFTAEATSDQGSTDVPSHTHGSLHAAILAAEKQIGRFAVGVAHSDPSEINDSLGQFSGAIAEVGEYTARIPAAQQSCNKIKEIIPELSRLSNFGNEEAHEARAHIAELISRVHDLLDAIASGNVEAEARVEEVVARQMGLLQTLSAAASVRSSQGVVTNLKQIAATQAKLLPLVAEYSGDNEELGQAIADLEALLPQHVAAAKGFLQDTSSPVAQQRLYSVIETMKAPLNGVRASLAPQSAYKAVEALEAKQTANAVMLRGATSSPSVVHASQAIYGTAANLSRQAQRIADAAAGDPKTQNRLLKSIGALNDLMEAQANAQTELEDDPNNAGARARLANASEALIAASTSLAGDLHDVDVVQQTLRDAVERKDAGGVEAALAELDDYVAETVNMVRAVGGGQGDEQDAWLQSSLAALDEAVKEQRDAARSAVVNGDSARLQEPMETVANQVAALRTHCAQQISGKPSDVQITTQALDTCNKAIDQLEVACKEGDGNNAASAARSLVDSSALATRHGKEAANHLDPVAKERAEHAITRVDERIPALLRATKAALNDENPDTVSLSLAAEDARHALGELAHAVAIPAEELLLAAQQTHRDRTKTLRDKVAAKQNGKASDKEVSEALHAAVESAKEVRDALKSLEHDNNDGAGHLTERVEKHLAALIACDRAAHEGRTNAATAAVYHAEQIDGETNSVTKSLAPELVSEAKQMEIAVERLANLLADSSVPLDIPSMNKTITDLVNHERALEQKLKSSQAELPPNTHAVATSLTSALRDEVLAKAVTAALAVAKEPQNSGARLAALSATAEVKVVAAKLVSTFQNVHANEAQKEKDEEGAAVVQAADAAQSVRDMIPELVKVVSTASAHPSSKDAQGKLAAAIDAIAGNISHFVQAAEHAPPSSSSPPSPSPTSPLANECAITLNVLGKMAEGTSKGDAAAVVESVKALAQEVPKLIEQVNALNAQNPNSEENRAMRDVAAELATQLPAHVETAKAFIKNTKSEPAKKDLLRSTMGMSNNVQQLRSLAKPPRTTQVKNLSDKVDQQSSELAKFFAARNKGGLAKALQDMKKTARELKDEAHDLEDQYTDPSRRMRVAAAIADLENRLKEKHGGGGGASGIDLEHAANALVDDPANSAKQKKFDEVLQYFQSACKGVSKAANASVPAKAHKEAHHVNSLARAARAGDPQGVVAAAREAAATQIQLIEEAKEEAKNTNNKDKVDAAAASLEKNLSQVVVSAKGVLQDPSNPVAQSQLASSVLQLNVPLAELAACSNPSPLSEVEAIASAEASQLMVLAQKPDPAQKEKVKETHKQLTEQVKKSLADPRLPPATADTLAKQLAELDRAIAEVEGLVAQGDGDKLSSACLAAQTPLARISDAAHTTSLLPPHESAPPAVANAVEKAKTLLAVLKNAKAGKIDLGVIMNSSQHLARTMADLVGLAKTQAYLGRATGNLSEAAERALALDELLTSLSNLGTPSAPPAHSIPSPITINISMDTLISSIGNEELATVPPPPPPQTESPVPADLPKPPSKKKAAAKKKDAPPTPPVKLTLDESLKQVASEIRAISTPVASTPPTAAQSVANTTSNSLATELERLAGAAHNNKRQDVLVCGRSIAALVSQICETLRTTAKESTNPLVQDKLLKSSQALKNYAIQLKILASVKAASTSLLDRDADEQLSTMTRALGSVLGEGLKAIDIHYKTTKKGK